MSNFSYSRTFPQTNSVFHAAVALTSGIQKYGQLRDMVSSLEEFVPLTVESVQHFASLVYAVRNPLFCLPRAMLYSKFRYVVAELVRSSGDRGVTFLDPELQIDKTTRSHEVDRASQENVSWCNNLLLLTVSTPVRDILSAQLSDETRVTFTSEFITLGFDHKLEICIRQYHVSSVATECDRVLFLRIIAAEGELVAPRSMLLLSDLTVPLTIIPGFTTIGSIIETGRTTELMKRSYD